MESLSTLRRLDLNIEETEFDDGSLEKLGTVLSKYEFLENIGLRISGNPVSMDSLENTLRKIEKLPSVTVLSLKARRIKAITSRKERMERLKKELKIATKNISY